MSEKKKGNVGVIVGVIVALAIAGGLIFYFLKFRDLRSQVALKEGAQSALPKASEEKPITPGSHGVEPSAVLHVNDPAGVRQLLAQNAWLTEVMQSPLGRGFGSGWLAFLQTKGEDLRATFKGTVASYLFDQVLAQPFSIMWVTDGAATGTPAFVIDDPKSAAKAAYEAMGAVAMRGVFTAKNCPGEAPGKDDKFKIARWLLADQALYAGLGNGRLALASKPSAVLQGLCAPVDTLKAGKPALELALYPNAFGREAQLFGALLGAENDLRLSVAIENNRLVPKGIAGALANAKHLAVAAPSDELLKLIPDDLPVALLMQVTLPKALDAKSLSAYFKEGKGETVPRQVALLWRPDGNGTLDVAMAWSVASDKPALQTLFGAGQPSWRVACGHALMASNPAFGERLERTCKGQNPSRANAQPDVVQGVKAAQSLALHVHLGALMSGLMLDAFKADKKTAPLPPEMEQAKKSLEALPFFGFRGRVEGSALVGEGFRS